MYYRRHLPHYQTAQREYFLTFTTRDRAILEPAARDIVLEEILNVHEQHARVHVAIVMPDHVHVIFQPHLDEQWRLCLVSRIVGVIKGRSSRRINLIRGAAGSIWQEESFDHEIRRKESLHAKAQYIAMNPVRKGLVKTPDAYPWLWWPGRPASS